MFGVLLESKGERRRFVRGSPVSIAIHAVIFGAAAAVGTIGPPIISGPRSVPDAIVPLNLPLPAPSVSSGTAHKGAHRAAVTKARSTQPAAELLATPKVDIQDIPIPPVDLPAILPNGPLATAADLAGSGRDSTGGRGIGGIPRGIIGPDDEGERAATWRGADVFMQMMTVIYPRYPESLRVAGVSGRVLVRFTVDTTGRVELSSVEVLESTNSLFTRAVIDALPRYRFRPAHQNGHRVTSVAELPVEFRIVDR